MRKDEVTKMLETLCNKFSTITMRIKETQDKNGKLDQRVRDLEEQEREDQQAHDKNIGTLNDLLKNRETEAISEVDMEEAMKANHRKQKELSEEVRLAKDRVAELERKLSTKEKELRMQEELRQKESSQRLKREELKRQLTDDNSMLRDTIGQLREEVTVLGHKMTNEVQDSSLQFMSVQEGKQGLRKMQEDTAKLEKKMAGIRDKLAKDARLLEGKESRLQTLKNMNKTLRKKIGQKSQLESRYSELTEQSLNLQYLISEVMNQLAKKFNILEQERQVDKWPGGGELIPPKLLKDQEEYIEHLAKVLEKKKCQMSKSKLANLL